MAQNVVINLDINADGAVKNMDAVEAAINETSGATKSLKAQLRDLQMQMQNLDPTDAKFEELSKQAGELKDVINDTADAVRNNAGNAFEGLSNNAQTLGGRLLDMDFAGVGQSAKAMAANVKGINFKLVSQELGGMVKGFAQLGKALLANPIFLIGAAVAAIIMNFDKLNELIAMSYAGETKALEAATENVTAQQSKLDAISAQENTLRLQGKSEREILEMKIAQTNEVINATRQQIEQQKVVLASQIAAETRAKSILTGILQFVSLPLQALAAQIDLLGEGLKKIGVISESFGLRDKLNQGINGLADMVFSPEEVKTKGEAQIAEMEKQLKGLENQRDGHRLAMNAIDKRAADDRKAVQDKAAEEQRIRDEQAANSRLSTMQGVADRELGLARSTANGIIQIDAEKQTALSKQVADAEAERLAQQKANAKAALDISGQTLQGLSALNELFAGKTRKEQERAFKINKGIRIAEAVIDTYKAANSAMATYPPPFGAIAAAASVAMGLANIAKIKKEKFGGSGGGSGGGGGSSPSVGGVAQGAQGGAPTFNPIDTSFLGNRPPQVAQTYVLAGHVSNAQDANAKISNLRRL